MICVFIITHSPKQSPLLISQASSSPAETPGEGGGIYFTQMTLQLRYKYLLEFADTFTWWAGAFPTPAKKTTKVCKSFLKEISSKSLRSDNKFSLIARITQGLSRALETGYNLHTSWEPQPSGKIEKMNHTLKKTIAKLCQETHEPWTNFLLIALLKVHVDPRIWNDLWKAFYYYWYLRIVFEGEHLKESCPILCEPKDYTVHGILQARILERVAFPFSRGSSQPRDGTQVSHIAGGFLTSWITKEAQEYWTG